MLLATITEEAAELHISNLNEGRQPSAGYARNEHMYLTVLRQLQGKRFAVAEDVMGGISEHILIIPDCEIVNRQNQPIYSKVIAIPEGYIKDLYRDYAPAKETPVEEPESKKIKYLVVRLLTPWVDGFQAFQQPEVIESLEGRQSECPKCQSTKLRISRWPDCGKCFHLCENCRARFLTQPEPEALAGHEQ